MGLIMVVYKSYEKEEKDAFKPYEINGYLVSKPLISASGGNCKWGFAEKYGKEFFIKEFLSPKYPDINAEISDSIRKMQIQECNEWFESHSRVYNAIMKNAGGNLILPLDFFRFKNNFYLITEKVESNGMHFEDIYRKSLEQRHILLKILAHEFSALAYSNVVHSDVKPDNLILKYTINNYFTVKIIDFDVSFLSTELPDSDDIVVDQKYYSPESILYMLEEEGEISPKADVFALGILFHQILCGRLPSYDEDNYDSVGEAVLNEQSIRLSEQISYEYRDLIQRMLYLNVEKRPSSMQVLKTLCEIETYWKKTEPDRFVLNGTTSEKRKGVEKSVSLKSSASGDSHWSKAPNLD